MDYITTRGIIPHIYNISEEEISEVIQEIKKNTDYVKTKTELRAMACNIILSLRHKKED